MGRQKKIVKEALEAAKIEGFINAEEWKENHLLVWYKAYLVWENRQIPKALRGILVDIGERDTT